MAHKTNKFFLLILFFLFISFIFNFSLLAELFSKKITLGDNILTELFIETSYQKILHLKNPFIFTSIFYPFTTNVSLNDPTTVYSFLFILIRPFLNPHHALIIITLISFLLNNIIMYILLRKLKINHYVSIIISLVFGFTPFLSHRVLGHYTYIPIYFFPLTYLIVHQFLETKSNKNKTLSSIIFGSFLAFVLLSNFYYFLIIILGILAFFCYFLICQKKQLLKFIILDFKYLVISLILFCLLLIPWFMSVYQLIISNDLTNIPSLGGAITLSADVLSFFTPSEYNPIYKIFFSKLASATPLFSKYNNFFLNSWERFVYPGIIVLGTYFLVILLKILRKFPSTLWNKIKPYFIISLVFTVLMLGPFLKVFNRWSINLDGVAVVFPLPFLLFHYIPGLSTLRAPSRFTPIFVFLACIVTAYIFDFLIKKVGKKKSLILIITLFIVFFLDQFYVIPTKLNQEIPTKIYYYLKDKPQGTVLEIPFTVRDGFNYIGFVHAIQPMAGQLIHGKPIIGGYIARVPDSIFNYYKSLKFIGYLAKIIDKGNYIPFKEKPKDTNLFPYPYPINTAKNEVKSLNIKYIILKEDEKYSNYLINLFKQIGFVEKQKDINYLLLVK